jgi:hypothetical protein
MFGRLFGALFVICAAVGFVLSPDTAEASAVKGCRIDGHIVEITTDTTSGKPEITLKLKVTTSEDFGHSAGPAFCPEPGSEYSIAVDNDDKITEDKLAVGDHISVESMTVYNVSAEGKSVHHSQGYTSRVPAPVTSPAPEKTP